MLGPSEETLDTILVKWEKRAEEPGNKGARGGVYEGSEKA